MYRQTFKPTETNSQIPFTVPKEWYGLNVEVIAYPVNFSLFIEEKNNKEKEIRQRREKMLKKYSFSRNGYKFDREEANDYD